MQIKEFGKQGLVSWSNSKAHSELLASAGLQEENGLYHIDILSLDLQERSKKINIIGSGYTDNAFRCLAWDNFGEKENLYPYGLMFTGMDNGSFKLWNPQEMIATYQSRQAPSLDNIDSQSCIVYEEQAEDGAFPVMCGEWNSLKNNFLAFGATDVLILDVSKDPTDPELVKPGKRNPHDGSYVTSVSWNREVSHILASASENGLVALWDIKTNNSIFQFKDSGASSSGNRSVVICWSKSISTQIAVTLDDEKRNELQIWDLRNQKGPVVVIDKCHSRGINAMDWCQTDPELILTASRDNRVVCWNYTQEQEPLSQTQADSSAFSVKWSKKLPSIYSVSTDEKTLVYTMSDTNLFSYVPKWYKVPVNSTIFGNNSVTTYSEQRGNVLHQNLIQQNAKPSALKAKLDTLSNNLDGKFDEADNQSELCSLLKAKAGGENDVEIYDYLGFSKSKIVQEVEKYTGKKREVHTGHQKEKGVKPKPKAYTQIQGQDALAFFASINNKVSEPEEEETSQRVSYDMVPRNFNWDLGHQRLVKQNILIGNYEGAIDAALKCGRTAEALIIAYSVDQNLFNNTLKTFFTETTDNFITDVLKHIAYRDPVELVKKHDLGKWKQCIALIFSIAGRDKRPHLLKLLAERLKAETQVDGREMIPENNPAIICYILAQDFATIVQLYYENLSFLRSGSQERKLAAIEYGTRLISIYQSLTVEATEVKLFHRIVREIAFIAIEEQQKVLAHKLFVTFIHFNSQKHIDYLVSTTKELQKYKGSVSIKPIILPVMQPKKVDKKNQKQDQAPVKQKGKIFPQKEEEIKVPTPPPIGKKRTEEESNTGFSPYQNNKSMGNQPIAKKNLNTPPPPPTAPLNVKKHHYQEQQAEREPTVSSIKTIQPPPQKKTTQPPPPPPPPSHHAPTNNTSFEQQAIIPVVKQPPPHKLVTKTSPPPPPMIEKKTSNPPYQQPSSQQKIPFPAQQEEDSRVQIFEPPRTIKLPPTAGQKKTPPPPPIPKIVQPHHQAQKQQYPQQQSQKRPPQNKLEQVKSRPMVPPPARTEEKKRYEQPEQVHEQPVRQNRPPPPPVKRGPPPPPVRK